MAETAEITETTEAAAEAATTEEDPAAQLAEAEATNASLRAMLKHFAADVDVDAEIENIAFRRDGTPVYVGDAKAVQEAAKEAPAAKAAPKPPVRTQPAQTRGAPGKASVAGMNDKALLDSVRSGGMKQFAT